MLTAPPIPLSLDYPPPLCMQRGRYSLSGVHAAALLKHAVVGRCLHHADYEGFCWCHLLFAKITDASASLLLQTTPTSFKVLR